MNASIAIASETVDGAEPNTAHAQISSQLASTLPGFEGVDWTRLKGYKVAVDNYDYKSWVWVHGWRLWHEKENSYWWLCKSCHQKKQTTKRLGEVKFCTSKATTGALNHMITKHNRDRNGQLRPAQDLSSKRKRLGLDAYDGNGYDRETERDNELAVAFNQCTFQAHLYRWIVADNIAFRKMQSPHLAALVEYLNPRCRLPHPTTVSRTIGFLYDKALGTVTEVLRSAITKINFSFDMWTSKNKLALLGIVAHFIDQEGKPITTLLALPRQHGRHTGLNISETIAEILTEFDVQDKLGYFITDNAYNNGSCLETLGNEFGFQYKRRWVRCSGHILNLAAQQVLFGAGAGSFEAEVENVKAEEAELALWRKRGPIGKLHNIVYFISRSPYRSERFVELQKRYVLEVRPDGAKETYELIKDVETRWNSFEASASRALYLQAPIDEFVQEISDEYDNYVRRMTLKSQPLKRQRLSVVDDRLSADDWATISSYQDMLQPLKEATLLLQGNAGGKFGAIWQVLPTFEKLLLHFEGLRVQYPVGKTASHFSTNINLGWQKLNEYYARMEDTPVYVAAIVLHPRMKWRWIERRWVDKPTWIKMAKSEFHMLWLEYQDSTSTATRVSPPPKRASRAREWFSDDSDEDGETIAIEQLAEYNSEPRHKTLKIEDSPIPFWLENRNRWPQLASMALDIFATPAMSDAPERVFSITGDVISPRRRTLGEDTVREVMCLRSWMDSGIIKLDGNFFTRLPTFDN